jgi:hypothetical protein
VLLRSKKVQKLFSYLSTGHHMGLQILIANFTR